MVALQVHTFYIYLCVHTSMHEESKSITEDLSLRLHPKTNLCMCKNINNLGKLLFDYLMNY